MPITRLSKAMITALVTGSALLFALQIKARFGNQDFDDAYMVARYARHWLGHHGYSWNISDGPSFGITSTLYLWVISAVMWLQPNWADAGVLTGASICFGVMTVLALTALVLLVRRNEGSPDWMPWLVAPSLMAAEAFQYHSLTGMETTLALLSNTALAGAAYWAALRPGWTAMAVCGLCGMLTSLTRPDNALYALLLPSLYLMAADIGRWPQAIKQLLVTGLALGIVLCINRWQFGSFVPLPFYAKSHGFYDGYAGWAKWNPVGAQIDFLKLAAPFLLAMALSVTRRSAMRVIAVLTPVLIMFGYYGTVVQIMGYQARYYVPALPFVVLAAAISWQGRPQETGQPGGSLNVSLARLTLAFTLWLAVTSVPAHQVLRWGWESRHTASAARQVTTTAQALRPSRARLPTLGVEGSREGMALLLSAVHGPAVVAASEHGVLGARFLDMTVIDVVGLHDPWIAHHGFDASYLLSRRPDVIWLPHPDYTGLVAALLGASGFQQQFDYFPDVLDFGVAVRKDSPLHDDLMRGLAMVFERHYPGHQVQEHLASPTVTASR